MRKRTILLILLAISTSFAWQRIWDLGSYVRTRDFIELSDGSFILVGRVIKAYVSPQVTVIRFNSDGDTLWVNYYGDVENDNYGWACLQNSDTSFIVTGRHSDFFTMMECLNLDGESLWGRMDEPLADSIGGYGFNLEFDRDGSIVSNADGEFKRFNSDGEVIWARLFERNTGFSAWLDMKPVKIPPYGYVVCGRYYSREEDEYWSMIAYYDTLGDTNWVKTLDYSHWNQLFDIEVIDNPAPGYPPGFIAVGELHSDGGTMISPALIVRTDLDGNVLWVNRFEHPMVDPVTGGSIDAADVVWAGNEPYQTRFAVVGDVRCDTVKVWLAILSDTLDGDTLWTRTFNDYVIDVNLLTKCMNGDYMIAGIYTGEPGSQYWLCRVDSLGNDVPYAIEEPHVPATPLPEQLEVAVFPNPFNSTVEISVTVPPDGVDNISVTIYDITGKMIKELTGSAGNNFLWNGTDQKGDDCPTGAYLYKVTCGDHIVTDNVLYVK